jgi:hypothetical protein
LDEVHSRWLERLITGAIGIVGSLAIELAAARNRQHSRLLEAGILKHVSPSRAI